MADVLDNGRCDISIIGRENGGPGAARNTGSIMSLATLTISVFLIQMTSSSQII